MEVEYLLISQHRSTSTFAMYAEFPPYLQVLEGVIKYRWNALPVQQRDGMKNYISEVIVKVLNFSVGKHLEYIEALGSFV